MHTTIPVNEETDLVLTRVVPATPEQLFSGWTKPELMKQWFAPKPWGIASAQVDLRPGGGSNVVMRSPEGQEFPSSGCYLEIIPNRKIVFTDALQANYRPSAEAFFTCILTFDPVEGGTRYTAHAMHKNAEDKQKHEEMGFHQGWGQCLDQLVELVTKK